MMRAISASQSTESSYAFLRRPLRRLQKVTCRFVVFSMRLISTFFPFPAAFSAEAAEAPTEAEAGDGIGSFGFRPTEVKADCKEITLVNQQVCKQMECVLVVRIRRI
jgi:hypothetical protein